MKIPIEWLKEYVTVRLKPAALAERLTMAGLEVTRIDTVNGEPVLDLEITPNRADCLSVIGVAREVAAITRQPMKAPKIPKGSKKRISHWSGRHQGGRGTPDARASGASIKIEDRKGCLRYIGRLIEGVTVAPSPEWMQRRLLACGARPINNVVDITNYVLLEIGQPLHAFDFDRLAGGTILVRRARKAEPITTLDTIARTLTPETLVIADARQAVAVAGIMGGVGSEVTDRTSTLLLESALFDPITVRRMARRLGLGSESSYRFERGVDPEGVERASARAAQLIEQIAGGTVRVVKDAGQKPPKRSVIVIETGRLNRWLGTSLPPASVRTTLARLACRVASSGTSSVLRVSVPSFRRDLALPVDLYEEIARMAGYERIRAALPVVPMTDARVQPSTEYAWRQSLRSFCAGLGLTEVINWSLISETELSRCGFQPREAVRLENPLSQDHAYLRPSLLMGLLQTVRRNLTQGAAGVRVFEMGATAGRSEPAASSLRLGIILSGEWIQDWRTGEVCDFFHLKGVLETMIGRVTSAALVMERGRTPWAAPDRITALTLDGRPLGSAGQVSAEITDALDIEHPVWFAELSVEALSALKRSTVAVQAPAAVPPVKRDLSVVVREETPFAAVAGTLREIGGDLAGRIALIDRYQGAQIPAGHYSLTFSIEYLDPSRTLTAEEADTLHQRIGRALVERFGATLR